MRLPLTSTRTSSGDKPRNCTGRTASVASTFEGCAKLIEGSTVRKAMLRLGAPVALRSLGVSTSIGASESTSVRLNERVPVLTTTAFKLVVFCFTAGGAASASGLPDAACCADTPAQASEMAAASKVRVAFLCKCMDDSVWRQVNFPVASASCHAHAPSKPGFDNTGRD